MENIAERMFLELKKNRRTGTFGRRWGTKGEAAVHLNSSSVERQRMFRCGKMDNTMEINLSSVFIQ